MTVLCKVGYFLGIVFGTLFFYCPLLLKNSFKEMTEKIPHDPKKTRSSISKAK